MPSTATHPLTILRATATRLHDAGWTYDAANLELAAKGLEPRAAGSVEARARRLFGSDWLRWEAEAAE